MNGKRKYGRRGIPAEGAENLKDKTGDKIPAGREENKQMKYQELPLSKEILQAVEKMGFTDMTEVQQKAIPPMLEGKEIMAKAPTGTGKTCAFGIPMIERLNPKEKAVQGIILAPTRELAIQIRDELRELCQFILGVRVCAVYGGQPIKTQIEQLKKGPQIVVATPGRMIDHIKHNTIRVNHVSAVVLDEADKMLDMGFYKDVKWILERCPKQSKLSMFSATTSREVMDISWLYQRDPEEIVVLPVEDNKPKITQYSIMSSGRQKIADLIHIIRYYHHKKAMIFCNTKYQTASLCRQLNEYGLPSECIHGDMIQSARNQVMQKFKSGAVDYLVVTDVAARGIDVEHIEAVFNFDLPQENEYYTHRIGRTGRAKQEGVAYTFYAEDEKFRLRDIIKYTKSDVTPVTVDEQGKLTPIK